MNANLSFLKPGQQIEVKLKNSEVKYFSRIEDVRENKIFIALPLKGNEVVPLEVGTTLDIMVYRENALYTFESIILDKTTSDVDKTPVLVMSQPTDYQKIQRRNFYRLDIQLPVKYRILKNVYAVATGPFIDTITKDISGGGLSIVVDRIIPKETILELVITLPQGEIQTLGRVVVVKGKDDAHRTLGIEFVGIEEPLREKIVKFIFQKQQEQRRKEMRWVEHIGM